MLNIVQANKPTNFDKKVSNKGKAFLASLNKQPTTEEWGSHNYWVKALPQLHTAYGGVCAYYCYYIEIAGGGVTVDHFEPKKYRPDLAYEWSNFRLASLKANQRKGTKSIIDPFALPLENEDHILEIDFATGEVYINKNLTTPTQQLIKETIDILKLGIVDKMVAKKWVKAL